jgi:hypothetical protein
MKGVKFLCQHCGGLFEYADIDKIAVNILEDAIVCKPCAFDDIVIANNNGVNGYASNYKAYDGQA